MVWTIGHLVYWTVFLDDLFWTFFFNYFLDHFIYYQRGGRQAISTQRGMG